MSCVTPPAWIVDDNDDHDASTYEVKVEIISEDVTIRLRAENDWMLLSVQDVKTIGQALLDAAGFVERVAHLTPGGIEPHRHADHVGPVSSSR